MQISVLKMWLSVLLVILGTLFGVGITENLPTHYGRSTYTRISARIRGGNDATLGQWPWMAALYFWNSEKKIKENQCSGSLIADTWVLTAAHCFASDHSKLVSVRLGDLDLNDKIADGAHPINVDYKAIFMPPKFNVMRSFFYDIAVVQLKKKVKLSKFISLVRLPFDSKFQNDKFYETKTPFTMGWGYQDELREIITTRLQYAQVDVENLENCLRKYAWNKINMSNDVICAGNYKKSICLGDSGGPLIVLDENIYYIVGVAAYGPKCGVKHPLNSVYTKIATYSSWIKNIPGIKF